MSEGRTICRLPAGVAARLRRHAERAHPEECCGLLLGRRETDAIVVEDCAESANLAVDPARAFEIDAGLRLRLQRNLRGTGRTVVGVYHSHPGGPADPSAADAARAEEPGFLWIVLGRGGALKAFAAPARPGGAFSNLELDAGGNPPTSSPCD